MAAPALPSLAPDDVEELRLALVMNGGVSLAVWIGGVASEINRLVRKEGAYGDLLSATATEARVDVISGTSAGGINGALLALAAVCDADLAPLRDVWLEQGSLEDLLRLPAGSDPPSLLQGNDHFLPALRRAFQTVRAAGRATLLDAQSVPIDLTLTTTLLRGNPNVIPDDFGTVIADVNHRARFCFRRGPDVGYDSFDDARIAERLAFAARATASFPVAFEPVFYPVDKAAQIGAPLPRDTHNMPESRFLLDGGILDNKPLDAAVRAIFAQRADRDVRRILAYVVPNPGTSARGTPDVPDEVPGIAQVALASLMELPSVQSISAQIEAVMHQNQQVRRKHQNRAGIMTLGQATLHSLCGGLFPVYRRRRLESSADYLLTEVSVGLVLATSGRQALGRRLRDWLMDRFLAEGDSVPWAPKRAPTDPEAPAEWTAWRWGVFALENMADMMLDVLRRTLRLTSPGGVHRDVRSRLMTLRKSAYDLFSAIKKRRADDRGFWHQQSTALVRLFADGRNDLREPTVRAWILGALEAWGQEFCAEGPKPLKDLALDTARVIAAAARIFRDDFPDASNWMRAEDRAAHESLRQHFDVLAPRGAAAEDVLRNLLVVEVVLNAFGSYRDVQDQYVELVQVSADVPTSFGGPDAAQDKLAGAQLANFSAFLKRSWRANDWMFGRLDGAERMSRVLLNPDRLRRLYSAYAGVVRHGGTAAALDRLHWVAVRAVASRGNRAYLEQQWRADLDRIQRELLFLDDPGVPVPEQLPVCAAALARRLHLEILRAELSVVASAVEHDLARGGSPRGFGADFALAMDQALRAAGGRALAPDKVVELFKRCKIGKERVESEIGSDLATSVASRTVAVAVAAGAGKHSNLGPVRKLFQAGRIPAIAFDFLAQGLITRSRTAVALYTAALTIGAALVVLAVSFAPEMPGVLTTTGAVLVVAAMAVAFLRYHVLAAAVTAIGGALIIAAFVLELLPFDEDTISLWRIAGVLLFLALACVVAYIVSRGPRSRFVRTGRPAP